MHKALHPWKWRWQIICVKKGERRLASVEDSVDTSLQRLDGCIQKRREKLITANKKYWQHENQQNDNNQKTKNGKKNNTMDVLSD